MNKVTVGGKKRSGGRLKELELELNFVLAAEIREACKTNFW